MTPESVLHTPMPISTSRLLADLLSPQRPVAPSAITGLAAADQERLWALAGQHRVLPLLGWLLANRAPALELPVGLRDRVAAATRETAMRNLMIQRELVEIRTVLDEAGIPFRALKGAGLAFHVYPAAALRPMRDLDIVVPRHQVLQAYSALQAAGLSRVEGFMTSPEDAVDRHVHLPPLKARCGRFAVEVHAKLFHFHDDGGAPLDDLTEDPGFWDRACRAQVGGAVVDYLCPEDQLLHLATHAIAGHEFNNGPLVLSDIAFLVRRHAIDWPVLQDRARRLGRARECDLLLQLVRDRWGDDGLPPCGLDERTAPGAEVLEAGILLMTCGGQDHLDTLLLGDFHERRGPLSRAAYLLGRAFPPPSLVRAEFGLAPGDWRVVLHYPRRWHRQLTRQVPKLWRSRGGRAPLPEPVQALMALRRWLEVPR